ncbi:hypothetical protein ANCCEY_02226 [Ancylostoma ceylanicum]|uniref:Uncharacterized protein n=1 Tax=Ancylostoma ceylanicum TaxID=53326 RepID=A0A0D6MCD2_9BILA|nr:hypothetical protein ANCCEY_02226 [Ancylostoma ceylanicum]
MEFASPFVIDTSTPESLERDFYAWLNMEGSQYLDTQPSRICISLPPIESSMGSRSYTENKEICYLESSLGDSPSSLSSTSLEDAPPPHTERDQVRSSGRNQLGRTYSPGLPLSMCEREEIVKLFQDYLLPLHISHLLEAFIPPWNLWMFTGEDYSVTTEKLSNMTAQYNK